MYNDILDEAYKIRKLDDKTLSASQAYVDKIMNIFYESTVCDSCAECAECPFKNACDTTYLLLNNLHAEMFERSALNSKRKLSENESEG